MEVEKNHRLVKDVFHGHPIGPMAPLFQWSSFAAPCQFGEHVRPPSFSAWSRATRSAQRNARHRSFAGPWLRGMKMRRMDSAPGIPRSVPSSLGCETAFHLSVRRPTVKRGSRGRAAGEAASFWREREREREGAEGRPKWILVEVCSRQGRLMASISVNQCRL